MNKKITFFLVFVLFQVTTSFGTTHKADTAVINQWIRDASKLVFVKPDIAVKYLDSVLESSSEISYDFGLYKNYNLRAITHYIRGEYDFSIKNYLEAVPFADKNDHIQEINLYNNISYSLRELGLSDSSMLYTIKASEFAKEHGLDEVYQVSILNIGYTYAEMGDYISAAKYVDLVTENSKISDNKEYVIKVYSFLALFYYKIGDFEESHKYFNYAISIDKEFDGLDFLSINYANLGLLYQRVALDYDTARYYYRKSVEMHKKADLPIKRLIANVNIGSTFIDELRLDSAMYYYNIVYKDTLLESFPIYQAAVFTNLGMYYVRNKQYNKARNFLNEGLLLSKDYELLVYQKNAYSELAILDSIQGDYKNAFHNIAQFHLVSDSLQLQEVEKWIAIGDYEKFVVKEKFANELLVKENENQHHKIVIQRVIIGIVLFSVGVLIIILLIISLNRKKVKSLNSSLKKSNITLENLNSDLMLQKKEMKELMMSKDRFVAILGHDLKNPFTGLLGLLELIEEDWDSISDEEKREALYHLNKSSKLTYQLLEDLLDWGKSQQGLIKAVKSEFELLPLLNEVKTIFSLSMNKKKQTLKLNLEDGFFLNTDRKLLSQILQNLLGNAIKYSHTKGEIEIYVQKEGEKVMISVKDSGIGIPEKEIDGLFKLDSTYSCKGTDDEMSTGMGLLLCKEYANLIGGELLVSSKEGMGSTFSLVINV